MQLLTAQAILTEVKFIYHVFICVWLCPYIWSEDSWRSLLLLHKVAKENASTPYACFSHAFCILATHI